MKAEDVYNLFEEKVKKQIASLKIILQGFETAFDQRTPKFGKVSKEDLQELRHWAIFVHSEINDGMIFVILHYLYPKGVFSRGVTPTGTQLARAQFIFNNLLEKRSFSGRLEVFKNLKEVYEFDSTLISLMKRVNRIRNDFAHPTINSLSKYVAYKNLHKAYADLVKGLSEFKLVIEKVKGNNLLLEV